MVGGLAVMLLLASCGGKRAGGAVAHVRPPVAAPVAPRADFARYLGHYPFDKVGKMSWGADPAVRSAVAGAISDAKVRHWVLDGAGPTTPIAMLDGRLSSWACEAHNCGGHQWIAMLDPQTGKAEVCYFDGDAPVQTRWFVDGREEKRNDDCPDNGS